MEPYKTVVMVNPLQCECCDPMDYAASLEMLADGFCPLCHDGLDADWSKADVDYIEDEGGGLEGPPPSVSYQVLSRDWSWVECKSACRGTFRLESFLRASGRYDYQLDRAMEEATGGVGGYKEARWGDG